MKVGITSKYEELDLDFVDENLLSVAYPIGSFIRCGVCSICHTTEKMPKDAANGTSCAINPESFSWRIVHCDSKVCIAKARAIFNIWLADKSLFFICQESARDLFPDQKIKILRSNGSIVDAILNLSMPFLLHKETIYACCSFFDPEEKYKFVSLLEIFSQNESLRMLWQSSKFYISYEKQIERFRPDFISTIKGYISNL